METSVEFRVLGTVEAWASGESIPFNGKQRSLLAILLLHPGQMLTTARLADMLWGRPAPVAPETRVRTLVSELRKKFAQHPDLIGTRPSGYVLQPAGHRLDLDAFSTALDQAREEFSAGRPERALACYDEALGLWRGSALGGASGSFIAAETARLDELRFVAVEERCEVLMALGRHADAVDRLRSLTAELPLRERMHALLMRAFYLNGNRRAALEVYRGLRERLVAELGLEPMHSLQDLLQQILAGDPRLEPHGHSFVRWPSSDLA